MLLAPKKSKYNKSFSGRKSLTMNDNKKILPRFSNYCIISHENGFVTNFQIEGLRRFLRRSFKKRGQIFFRIFPYLPITKKQSEVRLGRGKGKMKY
jgi:large subunit ribosomal protein L16